MRLLADYLGYEGEHRQEVGKGHGEARKDEMTTPALSLRTYQI